MRAATFTPHPDIKDRWDQIHTDNCRPIPEIPFFFIQPPRRLDYRAKGCKLIKGFKGNQQSILANLIPINDRLMFSDWNRPDKQRRDIAVLFLGDRIILFEYPDKSPTIEARRRRVSDHIKKHPVYGGLYQR